MTDIQGYVREAIFLVKDLWMRSYLCSAISLKLKTKGNK